MHLLESEWAVLSKMLIQPEKLMEHIPLMAPEELEARCDDIFESKEFNHHDMAEWTILMTCISESDIPETIKKSTMPYQLALDMVDAAFSLQDRFATRFPVDPSLWIEMMGSDIDEKMVVN